MRLTLKAVNQDLTKHNIEAILVNGGGYFFFRGRDVNDWLDRTVQVSKVSDLTVEHWMQAFNDLKRRNQEIVRSGTKKATRKLGGNR